MAYLKFPFQQNWKFNKTGNALPHGISRFAVLQKQEISKTGNALPHGISGVAVLADQHIAKNWLIHAQFYSFKDSTENKQSKSLQFSKVRNSTKHKWFTTMSRISSTIFQKVRTAAFVHSFSCSVCLLK